MLRMLVSGTWKHRGVNLAEATWLVSPRGPANHPGPAQMKPLHTVGADKILHMGKWLGKSVWISPPTEKENPFMGLSLPKDQGAFCG